MTLRTSPWPAGVPCWADLGAADLSATKAFYAAVLGWSFQDSGDEFGGYAIAEVSGSAAAGIGPLQPGAVPAWTVYFASDDADKTAAAVTENGGTVLMPPGDVGPMGRMFIAADPTGASFGVWQAKAMIGAGIANQPGGLTWEDLHSTDAATARTFYSAVFGHNTQPLPAAGDEYHTFSLANEEAPRGGMGGLMGVEGVGSHWLVYFGVADANAAVAAASAAGGSVQQEPFDSPYGRMAGLTDPAGGSFWVVETSDEEPAG